MDNYTTVQKPAMMVVGIECRTSNAPEAGSQDIPRLWAQFYNEDIINQIPIADFGFTVEVGQNQACHGTPGFIAPELLDTLFKPAAYKAAFAADVWSLGCVLADVCNLKIWSSLEARMQGRAQEAEKKLKDAESNLKQATPDQLKTYQDELDTARVKFVEINIEVQKFYSESALEERKRGIFGNISTPFRDADNIQEVIYHYLQLDPVKRPSAEAVAVKLSEL